MNTKRIADAIYLLGYRITTRTVGQAFGTCAEVRKNGKLVYTTGVVGYGNEGAAISRAESWIVAREGR